MLYGCLTGREREPQSFRICVNCASKGDIIQSPFHYRYLNLVISITKRLEQDGWKRELMDITTLHMLRAHKSVNQPKALTERSSCDLRRTAVY